MIVMVTDFDETVLNSINETLSAVLGVMYRDAIYMDLLTRFSLPKEKLPQNLPILSKVLEENFGQTTTHAITRAIAKRLYSELHLEMDDRENFGLDEYVQQAKEQLQHKL